MRRVWFQLFMLLFSMAEVFYWLERNPHWAVVFMFLGMFWVASLAITLDKQGIGGGQ